ncbi:MAG: hypothetical protein IPQ07_03320 [Myxococcales bacterium]|nr:hypothetical protein [Myxococcales bacterium]
MFARIADAFHDRAPGPDALTDELVDPGACEADQPPHLLTTIDGPLSSAFAVLAKAKDSGNAIDSELAADTQPPCVRTVALLAARVGLDPAYAPITSRPPSRPPPESARHPPPCRGSRQAVPERRGTSPGSPRSRPT